MLPEKLVISFLNVRPLRKHFDNNWNTSSLIQTDILCFTETQILPSKGGLEFYILYLHMTPVMTGFVALRCGIVKI